VDNHITEGLEDRVFQESQGVLEDLLRKGAQRMLQQAIEAEVSEYLARHALERDMNGHRLVVGNGKGYKRFLQTGIGDIEIRPPRVSDRRFGQRFTSSILPPYMRRIPSLEALLPVLYLKGISGNQFSEALESILGEGARGLSANTIMRLKSK
jgi:transposase-like protein